MRCVAALVLCAAPVASCAAPTRPAGPLAPPRVDALEARSVPAAFQDALGFDAFEGGDAAAPRTGDRLLYRVTLERGGEVETWFVRAELDERSSTSISFSIDATTTTTDGVEETHSVPISMRPCRVRVVDGSGELAAGSLSMPEVPLGRGLFAAAALTESFSEETEPRSLTEDEQQALFVGVYAALSLFAGWSDSEALAPLLERLVGSPSLGLLALAVVGGDLNLTMSLQLDETRSEPIVLSPSSGALPAYWVPGRITMAGRPLLFFEMRAAPCLAPLSTGMGIVGLRASHPSDGRRRVLVELVGARRAPGP